MSGFADRVIVVTGASSGIGRATALRLAGDGATVALIALDGPELESAAEECRAAGSAALPVPADVTDPQSGDGGVRPRRRPRPDRGRVQQRRHFDCRAGSFDLG